LGSLIRASDGNLYGMTPAGGSGTVAAGVIFRITPGGVYSVIYNFPGYYNPSYGDPFGSLIQASDGYLYGTTMSGGTGSSPGSGILFKCSLSGTFTLLLNFGGTTGPNFGSGAMNLMQANDGNLYGMTEYGGSNDNGVIYEYNITTNTYTKLLDFTGRDGAYPGDNGHGSLMQASDGNLYGMTEYGGLNNIGVIFQYNLNTGVYIDEYDFPNINVDGYFPLGFLTEASDGNLYGMTSGGGKNGEGNLFRFTPGSNINYTALYQFDPLNDNTGFPYGSLLKASDGNLYGLTYGLQTQKAWGTIFNYNIVSDTVKELYNFKGTDGANPHFTTPIDACLPTIIGNGSLLWFCR